MKNTLLASTALVLSVGAAAAADFTMADTGHDHSITLSGDARMGIIYNRVEICTEGCVFSDYDARFTSRARVEFTGSGETDGGLVSASVSALTMLVTPPTALADQSSSAKAATRWPWAMLTRLLRPLLAMSRALV